MSVYLYFGATQKGKSFHVFNHVVPQWDKVIIFDPTDSHKGDFEATEPNDLKVLELFRKCKDLQKYRIVIRTGDIQEDRATFRKAGVLAMHLGKDLKKKIGKVLEAKRIQLIVDEASTSGITSSGYFPPFLRRLVSKGRHLNIDCHLISQNPMAIHGQIREQAKKIVTFSLNNHKAPVFKETFGELSHFIRKLGNFWRIEWWDNEEIRIFDEKNVIFQSFLENGKKLTRKKGAEDGLQD